MIESDYDWSPFPFSPFEIFDVEKSQNANGVGETACNMDENVLEEGEINKESDEEDEGISETISSNASGKNDGCRGRCQTGDAGRAVSNCERR